jgi:hypothetical protein
VSIRKMRLAADGFSTGRGPGLDVSKAVFRDITAPLLLGDNT